MVSAVIFRVRVRSPTRSLSAWSLVFLCCFLRFPPTLQKIPLIGFPKLPIMSEWACESDNAYVWCVIDWHPVQGLLRPVHRKNWIKTSEWLCFYMFYWFRARSCTRQCFLLINLQHLRKWKNFIIPLNFVSWQVWIKTIQIPVGVSKELSLFPLYSRTCSSFNSVLMCFNFFIILYSVWYTILSVCS